MPVGPVIERDERLREYATERQWQILEAYWEHGGYGKTARALSLGVTTVQSSVNAVRKKAALQGYSPEHNLTHSIPDGYKLRGHSALYKRGESEPVLEWVKTTQDQARQEELLREMVAGLSGELVRVEPQPFAEKADDDLLAVYPIGDHHLGMYAWREEAGADYDMAKSERLLADAFDALTASMPPARQALVVFLGDLFHYDGLEPVTPTAKNQLDSDGRYALMVRTGVRLVRRAIATTLERHSCARVVVQAGNHDPSSSLFLAECLAAMYEDEPRVEVDTSPRAFHYHEFGRNLIGICHGHEVKKLDALPLIMARDRPEAWGRTRYRAWLTGHVHHDRVMDIQGTRVESFRVLPPSDAWADGKGYRAAREMKAILLHSRHGEVQRVSVRPEMFDGEGDSCA
jgi:UDP-2,3-diacylglucosamine pyrophosphatase LpxH